MDFFGVRILGLNDESLRKLLLTIAVLGIAFALRAAFGVVVGGHTTMSRKKFWFRKTVRLGIGAVATLLVLSIWFDSANRLATFTGLIAAGAAFASQNAVLSVAGYFVIVFGKMFDIGDRIELGTVRGDVLDIGLFKTTVMEMGVPNALQPDPRHWIHSRQHTGRVVTITNSEVFKNPTYNYTRNFEFLWEELQIPLRYDGDLDSAEAIVLDAVREVTHDTLAEGRRALTRMQERYLVQAGDLEPQTYVRLTDSWIELSVRFLVNARGTRSTKDQIVRRILRGFRQSGIEIATASFEVVRVPKLELTAAAPESGDEARPH